MARQEAKTLDQVEAELNQKDEKKDKRSEVKELSVERVPNGLYRIVFSAGGEVPNKLKGLWTSSVRAQEAIELHKSGRL